MKIIHILFSILSIASACAQAVSNSMPASSNVSAAVQTTDSNSIPANAASGSVNDNLINIVAVGYDIGNNQNAQKMLQDIGQAARDAGAIGEVILAGQDQAELDTAMQQAMSIATKPAGPSYELALKTPVVESGKKIAVVHSDFVFEDPHAWIGFYAKTDDKDENYLAYTFLRNLTDRTYDVAAPDAPGDQYHFRLFLSKEYDCVVRSESVRVIQP